LMRRQHLFDQNMRLRTQQTPAPGPMEQQNMRNMSVDYSFAAPNPPEPIVVKGREPNKKGLRRD
jgi:hypothetical protein